MKFETTFYRIEAKYYGKDKWQEIPTFYLIESDKIINEETARAFATVMIATLTNATSIMIEAEQAIV